MLTEKQRRFCEEYITCFHATNSAIKAGYSEKTAYSIGSDNLKKPEIINYIKYLRTQMLDEKIATAQEIEVFLSDVALGRIEEEVMVCVDGVYQKIKRPIAMKERIKAGELMAKRHGILTENIKMDVTDQVTILEDIPNE